MIIKCLLHVKSRVLRVWQARHKWGDPAAGSAGLRAKCAQIDDCHGSLVDGPMTNAQAQPASTIDKPSSKAVMRWSCHNVIVS
jgi:hypothetical protein